MGLSQVQKDQLIQLWIRQEFPGGTLRADLIPGAKGRFRRGRNIDVDQGSLPVSIWPEGGLYPFQVTPYQLTVVSDDANDSAAGTGAQQIQILGLDENLIRVEEIIELNGLTPVLTVRTDWLRTAEILVIRPGTDPSETNLGTITASVNGGTGDVQAVVIPGFGATTQAQHTVEADTTGFVVGRGAQLLSAGTGTEVEVSLFVRIPGSAWTVFEQFSLRASGTSGFLDSRAQFPSVLPSGTDIDVRITLADSNNIAVLTSLDILEVENDLLQTIVS